MVDSLVVDEVMKLVSMRERPTVDNARGKILPDQRRHGFLISFDAHDDRVVVSGRHRVGVQRTDDQDRCLRPRHGFKRISRFSPPALPVRCAGGQRPGLDDRPLRCASPSPQQLSVGAMGGSFGFPSVCQFEIEN